jgi:hypothetical protein
MSRSQPRRDELHESLTRSENQPGLGTRVTRPSERSAWTTRREVAADSSRRHLPFNMHAPTAVGGYGVWANRAASAMAGRGVNQLA